MIACLDGTVDLAVWDLFGMVCRKVESCVFRIDSGEAGRLVLLRSFGSIIKFESCIPPPYEKARPRRPLRTRSERSQKTRCGTHSEGYKAWKPSY